MEDDATRLDPLKRLRWDGHTRSHFETWSTTMNQLTSGAGFWIQYSLLVPRREEISVQVLFTSYVPDLGDANVAVAQIYPANQFFAEPYPFLLKMGPCSLQSGRMTGMIEANGTPVTWDLVYEPVTDPLHYLPEVFYKTGMIGSKVLTPHPFMSIGGKIQIRDHSFILNNDTGQQIHAWGRRYPAEWVWFHCSSFLEQGSDPLAAYVTGLIAQPHLVGNFLMNRLSFGHLVWKEKHLQLRPETSWGQRWESPWEWKGSLGEEEVVVALTLPWAEMVLAKYEEPSGRAVYCHHTDRADCSVRFRAPRQPPNIFRSVGRAHLEIGSRTADARAKRKVRIQT